MINHLTAVSIAASLHFTILLVLAPFTAWSHEFVEANDNAIVYRRLSDSTNDDDDDTSFTTQVTFHEIFQVMLFIVVVHYVGELGTVVKTPALVGQIFAGIALGPQVLNFVPFGKSLVLLGEIGLILLMFEVGVEVDIAVIRSTGKSPVLISVLCASLATCCGIGVGIAFGTNFQGAFSIGATFAQTSLIACLPVLQAGDLMRAPVGQMILAAAMIDDMIALTLLSVMDSFDSDKRPVIHYFLPIISSISWLVTLGFLAIFIAPRVIDGIILPRVNRKYQNSMLCSIMTAVALAYMPLLKHTKASYLMGATLAGMTFSQCKTGKEVFSQCRTIYGFLMKLFFAASIGFQIPIQLFGESRVWIIGSTFACTAVIIKAVSSLMVPKYQEEDVMYNLHRRDKIVTAFTMMSRGSFGFLISAHAFNENLIDAEMYASTVLAILIATIFPTCALNFFIMKEEELKKKAQKAKEISLEMVDDGKIPLYLQVNIETKGAWGLLEKIINDISIIGLKVEDFKSSHGHGFDPTIATVFYLRDDEFMVEIGDGGEAVENRLVEIRDAMVVKLKSFDPLIDLCPWNPFDAVALEALSVLTRANGEEPSLDYFNTLFRILDKDNDGEMTKDELKERLRAININDSNGGLEILMKIMDANNEGVISFDKWNGTISYLQMKKMNTLRVSTDESRSNRPESDMNEPIRAISRRIGKIVSDSNHMNSIRSHINEMDTNQS